MAYEPKKITMIKNGRPFKFFYDPKNENEAIDLLIENLQDPKSDLTRFDAALLSQQMGEVPAAEMQRRLKTLPKLRKK